MKVRLDVHRVTHFMLCAIVTFVALHMGSAVLDYGFGYERQGGFRWLTSLDMEQNPAAWYQTISMFVCGVLLALIGQAERGRGAKRWGYWFSIAAIFCFLSLDEFGALHERISEPIRRLIGGEGVLRFAWIVGWGAALLVIGVTHLRWLVTLPKATRTAFILAGMTFVAGAVGGEMVESAIYSRIQTFHHVGYELTVVVEEVLEMVGILLFVRALLSRLLFDVQEVRLSLRRAPEGATAPVPELVPRAVDRTVA